jgi:ATP-binding cassette subfamily F protein uup
LARLERQLAKFEQREAELHAALAEHATDYLRVAELNDQLRQLLTEKDEAESRWLEVSDQL